MTYSKLSDAKMNFLNRDSLSLFRPRFKFERSIEEESVIKISSVYSRTSCMENSKNVCPAFILNKGSATDGSVHHADGASSHRMDGTDRKNPPPGKIRKWRVSRTMRWERARANGTNERQEGWEEAGGALIKLNNTQRNGEIKERERGYGCA